MAFNDFLRSYGHNPPHIPTIAGAYANRNLIVCGDGACLWDDLERLGCRDDSGRGKVVPPSPEWDFMVVNGAGMYFPGLIKHWYSNEPEVLNKFVAARRNEYRQEFRGSMVTHSSNSGTDYRWPWGGHGTSGLGAILVGLMLGYEQIILCGMPLDDGRHNGEPPWRRCAFTREASDQKGGGIPMHWKRAIEGAFEGKVSSMSGRTRAWLGEPGEAINESAA